MYLEVLLPEATLFYRILKSSENDFQETRLWTRLLYKTEPVVCRLEYFLGLAYLTLGTPLSVNNTQPQGNL